MSTVSKILRRFLYNFWGRINGKDLQNRIDAGEDIKIGPGVCRLNKKLHIHDTRFEAREVMFIGPDDDGVLFIEASDIKIEDCQIYYTNGHVVIDILSGNNIIITDNTIHYKGER